MMEGAQGGWRTSVALVIMMRIMRMNDGDDDDDDDDGRRARGLAHLSGLGASAVPTVRASTSPAVPAS